LISATAIAFLSEITIVDVGMAASVKEMTDHIDKHFDPFRRHENERMALEHVKEAIHAKVLKDRASRLSSAR
jgi:hypothetical protein